MSSGRGTSPSAWVLVLLIAVLVLVPVRYIDFGLPGVVGATVRHLELAGCAMLAGLWWSMRTRSKPDDVWRVAACVVMLSALSSIGSAAPGPALIRTAYLTLTGITACLVVRDVLQRSQDVQLVYVAFPVIASILAVFGVVEYLFGGPMPYASVFSLENPSYRDLVLGSDYESTKRIMGTVGHPVVLGGLLVGFLPFSIYWLEDGGARGKLLGTLATGATAMALLFTFARGAWLSVVVSAAVYVGLRRRLAGKSSYVRMGSLHRIAVVGAVLTVLLWLGLHRPTRTALAGRFSTELIDPSANTRLQAWQYAAEMVGGRMLLGVGVGEYRALAGLLGSQLQTPDNSVLLVLTERGVVGLAASVWLLVSIGRILCVGLRSIEHDRSGQLRLIAACASVAGLLADMLTFDALRVPVCRLVFWSILGTALAEVSHLRHRDRLGR